jgi:hypothetical protein
VRLKRYFAAIARSIGVAFVAGGGGVRRMGHGATVNHPRRAQQDANPPAAHSIRASRHAYDEELLQMKSVAKTGNRN